MVQKIAFVIEFGTRLDYSKTSRTVITKCLGAYSRLKIRFSPGKNRPINCPCGEREKARIHHSLV